MPDPTEQPRLVREIPEVDLDRDDSPEAAAEAEEN